MLRNLGMTATRMAALVWSPPRTLGRPAIIPGRITEIPAFGSNPGALRMFLHAPAKIPPAGAPLIVVLHGCRQSAASFATHAGWIALADQLGIPLVLPEQVTTNNRNRCFNWYRPGDVARGQGEAMSIRQMIRTATALFSSDRRRVFIVGLSAGGAMAAAMLAAYPAVFAAGAVVAGMPVGAASTSPMALLRMSRADPLRGRTGLVAAVRAMAPARGKQPWPRLSIWQGEKDRTVNPDNAELLAAQWSGLHNLPSVADSDTVEAPGIRRRGWGKPQRPAVELWTIADLAHGFPIDGSGRPGPWVVDAGIPGTRHIAKFWGIE